MLRRAKIILDREIGRLRYRPSPGSGREADIHAQTAITLNETGNEVWSKGADEPVQGASTVKLVSAHLAATRLRLDQHVEVITGDSPLPPSKLHPGDSATVQDLIHASIIASDGHAAGALARAVGHAALVDEGAAEPAPDVARARYRQIAQEAMRGYGWDRHELVDPVGADEGNRFTARQIAEFLYELRRSDAFVYRVASRRAALIRVRGRRLRPILLVSTLRPYTVAVPETIAGKTGWLFGPAYLVWTWQRPAGEVWTSALMVSDNEHRVRDARSVIDVSVRSSKLGR